MEDALIGFTWLPAAALQLGLCVIVMQINEPKAGLASLPPNPLSCLVLLEMNPSFADPRGY
jgi:hypothetical protein